MPKYKDSKSLNDKFISAAKNDTKSIQKWSDRRDRKHLFLWVYPVDKNGKYHKVFYFEYADKDDVRESANHKSYRAHHRILLGEYGPMSLQEARAKTDEYNLILKRGENLKAYIENKNDAGSKKNRTFEYVCEQMLNEIASEHAAGTIKTLRSAYKNRVLPCLGNKIISEIDVRTSMTEVIKREKLNGASRDRIMATIAKAYKVLDYAVLNGYRDYTPLPSSKVFASILPQRNVYEKKHRAATLELTELGKILRFIKDYTKGRYEIRYALKIIPHIFTRSSELLGLTWDQISFDDRTIRIKITKTAKSGLSEIIIPMSNQVYTLFKELRDIKDHDPSAVSDTKCFTGITNRDNTRHDYPHTQTLMRCLINSGVDSKKTTIHGFRATATYWLREFLWPSQCIDFELAHMPKDMTNIGAYDRYKADKLIETRKLMMQAYSDFLDDVSIDTPEKEIREKYTYVEYINRNKGSIFH